ncbi:DUF2510 domain-containing protein [Microbacterium maritypicum]
MTTPAGWYDDGSGRQRWWDGQQWTEHFAPEAADAAVDPDAHAGSSEQAGSSASSIDDTVIRTSDDTATTPPSPDATAPTTPLSDDLAYSAPAAPAEVPAPSADVYPGTAPAYSGSTTGYPAAAPYGQPAVEEPKKLSILGLVGLGLGVLGTILVFIPVIGFFGFILLGAGFIVSLISLFLKGKKWPGIAGLILAVVGTIIGIVMSFVYLFAFAQGVSEEIDKLPTSSPSIEATPSETEGTEGTDVGVRPTAPEVAQGLTAILASSGAEGYTEAQITCLADLFVASDLDNATLRTIADSDGTLTDTDALYGVAEVLGDTNAIAGCLTP